MVLNDREAELIAFVRAVAAEVQGVREERVGAVQVHPDIEVQGLREYDCEEPDLQEGIGFQGVVHAVQAQFPGSVQVPWDYSASEHLGEPCHSYLVEQHCHRHRGVLNLVGLAALEGENEKDDQESESLSDLDRTVPVERMG